MGRNGISAAERKRRFLFISGIFLLAAAAALLLGHMGARTYVITDGSRRITFTTFARDPAQVCAEAGLGLEPGDTCREDSRGSITVCRAGRVKVLYHGEVISVPAGAETVAELLAGLGLVPGEGDVLSHALEERTFAGMVLRVDSVTTRQETYTATWAHETKVCTDVTMPAGEEAVLVSGRDGELRRTAEVTYINGIERERTILSESVTIPAVTEVVAVGTGDAVPEEPVPEIEIGEGYIRLPDGQVLTYTHTDNIRATGYTHTDPGCDRITSTGTTVRRGTVAVDPRFIPYGTRMFIVSHDGYVYGMAVAEDCGGAIKRDRMDLYFPTYDECIQFGYRRCTIYFLG